MRGLSRLSAVIAAVAIVFASLSFAYADTGSVHLRVNKAGFIVGVGGGTGVLTFKGKHYRLTLGGIGAGTIGVAGAELVGTASNLHAPGDIVGAYSVVTGSVAVVAGRKVATLQNSNGVVLHLHGKQVGFEASLGLGGLTISMQ